MTRPRSSISCAARTTDARRWGSPTRRSRRSRRAIRARNADVRFPCWARAVSLAELEGDRPRFGLARVRPRSPRRPWSSRADRTERRRLRARLEAALTPQSLGRAAALLPLRGPARWPHQPSARQRLSGTLLGNARHGSGRPDQHLSPSALLRPRTGPREAEPARYS